MFAGVPFRSENGSDLILSRCPEDESVCYVLKVEENENGKTAVCAMCLQLLENLPEGVQKFLQRCKITAGSALDANPWSFQHLRGCQPKKFSDIMGRGEHSSRRRSKRLASTNATEFMDTVSVTDVDTTLDDMSDSPDKIQEGVAGDEHDDSMYPVAVVKKKAAISYLYRQPEDQNLCYKFYNASWNKNSHLKCTSCDLACFKLQKKVVCGNFAGYYMLEDPSLKHAPGCRPYLYSEVVKKYHILQQDQNKQQSNFVLERMQRKVYVALFRFSAPADISKCYLFYPNFVHGSLKGMTCATCKNRCNGGRRKSHHSENYRVKHRRFTVNGFIEDPTKSHHSYCKPLLYNDVMKDYEVVDGETAKFFFQSGRVGLQVDDLDDSINVPKKIRLSEDDSFIDSSQAIITDGDSMVSEESVTSTTNSNGDVQAHRQGAPVHETSTALNITSNSIRHNANSEDDNDIEVPNTVMNRLPNSGCANSEKRAKPVVDISSRGAMVQPERSQHNADAPDLALYGEYKTVTINHTLWFPANGFTQDEMSWEIDGEDILVKFQRTIAAPFTSNGSTTIQQSMSVKFREPVDLETVEGVVKNNKVYLTASSQ